MSAWPKRNGKHALVTGIHDLPPGTVDGFQGRPAMSDLEAASR